MSNFPWSSDSIVAEYKDLQASAMAVDQKGQFGLLAGYRNIVIIDLDKPQEFLKRTPQIQKCSVSAAEWNPSSHLRTVFALAAGEKACLYNWHEGTLSTEAILRAHTRTITDLSWHRSEANLLATCSIDTFLHVWDRREKRKPILSFSAIAGASQVKWNKLNDDYLASGHDCDIRIWDRRKSSQPVCYINAHLSKIHGLDWSPNHETQIVSSSNDSSVKFFDITNPRKSEIFLNTQSPVWRARYTPFGEGLVTVVVPPLRRGENSLLLWSMIDTSGPVHTFVGHSDVVLEFEWRNSTEDFLPSEFQLVTWAKDNSLRIWKIDPQLLKICGHTMDEEAVFADESNVESSDTETLLGCENGDPSLWGKEALTSQCDLDLTKQQNGLQLSLPLLPSSLASSGSDGLTIEMEKKVAPSPLSVSKRTKEVLSQSPDTAGHPSLSQTYPIPETSVASRVQPPVYSLQQEFASLYLDSNVCDWFSDASKRLCQVTVKQGNFTAALTITFPAKYPHGVCPGFRFTNGTNIDSHTKAELMKVLRSTALQYTSIKKKKGCLEPCIKIFINQLKALLTEERTNVLDVGIPGAPLHVNSYFLQVYGSQQDFSIPFPRTSGARFCSSGLIICFTRPTLSRQGTPRERSTPRSLSALGGHVNPLFSQMSSASATSPKYNYLYPAVGQSPSGEQTVSISMYYYHDRKMKKRGKDGDGDTRVQRFGLVSIYDASKLIPISKELASAYVLEEDDMAGSCNKNMEIAATFGRKDLTQVWALVGASLSVNSLHNPKEDFPWIHHPFGRKMILSLIDHYHSRSDVQTAALLTCVLGEKTSKQNKSKGETWKNEPDNTSGCLNCSPTPRSRRYFSVLAKLEVLNVIKLGKTGGSPYNTIHGLNTDSLEVSNAIRQNRSNSEGSLTEAARPATENQVWTGGNAKVKKKIPSLLDPCKLHRYNEIRAAYANILYRWDLLEQRAMVNKFTVEYPSRRGIEFNVDCSNCGHSCRDAQCQYCKKLPHICSLCRLPVRGSSNFCLVCGHGGHTDHYFDWFIEFEDCPTGCGCKCLTEMEGLFT